MKRMKKIPMLLASVPLLLTSCSTTIAGTYGFQLGKDKGTHFGIFITLTDTKYKNNNPEAEIDPRAKKCKYKFSFNLGSSDESETGNLLSGLAGLLGEEATFNGYYYENGKPSKDGTTELKIGVDFSFIKDLFDDEEEDPTDPDDFPVISPDTIEKIVYTTYKNAVVTLNIPVSEVDVIYQLYWYGIDFSYSESTGLEFITSPYGEHQPGTHPEETDVQAINNLGYAEAHREFAEKFNIDLHSYRDFYTLAMGLNKN